MDLSASKALSTPKIVKIEPNLYVVSLEVMKVIPAKYIIEKALSENVINKDSLILESSSGNFAYGLAVVCNEKGLKLKIVGDPAIDQHLKTMLESLGAEVEIIKKPDENGAYQKLRLQRIDEIQLENENAFWIQQYDNLHNPEAYESLASAILKAVPNSVDLVASVGSGGSSTGLSSALRKRFPHSKLIGVDTYNSILFGLMDGPRIIRGLGNSIIPKVLRHELFDEVHWLNGHTGHHGTKELFKEHSIFAGPTSGCAYWVARYLAVQNPNRNYLFIAPDSGYRYLSTVHSKDHEICAEEVADIPVAVDELSDVSENHFWSMFKWNRKTLAYHQRNSKELI